MIPLDYYRLENIVIGWNGEVEHHDNKAYAGWNGHKFAYDGITQFIFFCGKQKWELIWRTLNLSSS